MGGWNKPTTTDACMCGCGFLNGGMAILVVQFFTLMGSLLSLGSLVDCSFATIDTITLNLNDELEIDVIGVGLLFFQKIDGHCYWYNDFSSNTNDENADSQLSVYWNFVGHAWVIASILTWISVALSWFYFFYSLSFCCSAQHKVFRNTSGFLLAGVLTIFQCSTFVVYGEPFCKSNNCSFSRGSGTSIGAAVCFVIAGLGFFRMRDYPGKNGLSKDEHQLQPWVQPRPQRREDRYMDETDSDPGDPDIASAERGEIH